MDRWTDGPMDRWTDEQILSSLPVLFLLARDFARGVQVGAANTYSTPKFQTSPHGTMRLLQFSRYTRALTRRSVTERSKDFFSQQLFVAIAPMTKLFRRDT